MAHAPRDRRAHDGAGRGQTRYRAPRERRLTAVSAAIAKSHPARLYGASGMRVQPAAQPEDPGLALFPPAPVGDAVPPPFAVAPPIPVAGPPPPGALELE